MKTISLNKCLLYLYAGKLYAIGGHDGTDHLNSGEMLDPQTNKWKPIAPMTTLR